MNLLKTLAAAAFAAALGTFAAPPASADEECVGVRVYRPDIPNKWVVVQLFGVNAEDIAACNRIPSNTVNRVETLAVGQPNESIGVHVGFRGRDGGWFFVPATCAEGLRMVTNETTTGVFEGWAASRNDRDADDRWIVRLDLVRAPG